MAQDVYLSEFRTLHSASVSIIAISSTIQNAIDCALKKAQSMYGRHGITLEWNHEINDIYPEVMCEALIDNEMVFSIIKFTVDG